MQRKGDVDTAVVNGLGGQRSPAWALGTELQSPGRAVSTLNNRATLRNAENHQYWSLSTLQQGTKTKFQAGACPGIVSAIADGGSCGPHKEDL